MERGQCQALPDKIPMGRVRTRWMPAWTSHFPRTLAQSKAPPHVRSRNSEVTELKLEMTEKMWKRNFIVLRATEQGLDRD